MKSKTIQVKYPGEFHITFTRTSSTTDAADLEQTFGEWNAGSGMESELYLNQRTLRPLSVNDLVAIDGRWWQCRSVGWKSVSEAFVAGLDNAVKQHPTFKATGSSWFTLDEIMREYRNILREESIWMPV